VVRDVLGRLHERGLIEKTQSSHWVAGALTAQTVRERFQVRQLLEPEALRTVGDRIEFDKLARARARFRAGESVAGGPAEWIEWDRALMEHAVLRAPNTHLVEFIRQNQLPLAAASRALTKLGLPEDTVAANEYLVLFDLILDRAIPAAAMYWRDHLGNVAKKNLARLKLVAVIRDPPLGVPYLTLRDVY
jgi:DNA-binding GntR family transcriptional regulator